MNEVNKTQSVEKLIEEIKSKLQKAPTQYKIFCLLLDREWHCRNCEGKNVSASGQYAGGGGIQGLQRGSRNRPGLVIKTEQYKCPICKKKTTRDQWTGEIQESNVAANIPKSLEKRIFDVYSHTDVIEERKREKHELIIDHRFPMGRWGKSEEKHRVDMDEQEIKKKFQVLKKDSAGNHNLLKSRACERCVKEGKRGTPFGIKFWYQGNEPWSSPHQQGPEAEEGCIGCGWYDFETWRKALNEKILH